MYFAWWNEATSLRLGTLQVADAELTHSLGVANEKVQTRKYRPGRTDQEEQRTGVTGSDQATWLVLRNGRHVDNLATETRSLAPLEVPCWRSTKDGQCDHSEDRRSKFNSEAQ